VILTTLYLTDAKNTGKWFEWFCLVPPFSEVHLLQDSKIVTPLSSVNDIPFRSPFSCEGL
jgi:hypothetical protein